MDRRVRKTRQLLKQGLISLLMEKDIGEITVKELVDRIDINRGTFYLHCNDIRDLFRQIEEEAMTELLTVVDGIYPKTLQTALEAVFHYLEANRDLAVLMLLKNGDQVFVERLKRLLEDRYFQVIREQYQLPNTMRHRLFSAYAISGCVGIIQRWLEEDIDMKPCELAEFAARLINEGVQYFD